MIQLHLTQKDEDNGCIPLQYVTIHSTIQGFRAVSEAGIIYYPTKKGITLLFQKDEDDDTPFQIACRNFGRDKVTDVIEDTLFYFQRRSDDDNNNGPYNIMDALLSAAIDEDAHLDCVYFLMRQEPDLLVKLLPQSSSTSSSSESPVSPVLALLVSESVVGAPNGNDNNNNDNSSKKRKRKEKVVHK